MKRKHSVDYVLKIAEEYEYTLDEVRSQVNAYTGKQHNIFEALDYLTDCNSDWIRLILGLNRFR